MAPSLIYVTRTKNSSFRRWLDVTDSYALRDDMTLVQWLARVSPYVTRAKRYMNETSKGTRYESA